MAIKGILFNTDMVRAILDGRKTATRRVMKPQPIWDSCDMCWSWKDIGWWRDGWNPVEAITYKNMPYQPGDYMYVRETWTQFDRTAFDDYLLYPSGGLWTAYKADGEIRYNGGESIGKLSGCEKFKWHPSIHMPKEAARIWLFCEKAEVEQLGGITDSEVIREGFLNKKDFLDTFYKLYPETSESTWVWKISFKKMQKPI